MDARQAKKIWRAVLVGDAQLVSRLLLPHSAGNHLSGARAFARTAAAAQTTPQQTELRYSRSHLLRLAVECGDVATLTLLIAHCNVSVDAPLKAHRRTLEPRRKYSPLMLAASRGDVTMMRVLLAHGAQANYLHRWTPLLVAVLSSSADAVRLLLEHGADAEREGARNRDRALSLAVRLNEDTEILRILLDHGVQVNALQHRRQTPLYLAASSPKLEVVDLLIAHGADVNARDDAHRTALHGAADHDFDHVVKVLIAEGAGVEATDWWGRTAMHHAALHSRTLTALLAHGASVLTPDADGLTPLCLATMYGKVDAVHVLLDAHEVCEELVCSAELLASVLDGAVAQDREAVISALLDKLHQRATSGRLDSVYRCALLTAVRGHRWRIAKLLTQASTSLNTPDAEGRTLMSHAVETGNLHFVQLLLESGASADSPEALLIASKKGFADAESYLLTTGASQHDSGRSVFESDGKSESLEITESGSQD